MNQKKNIKNDPLIRTSSTPYSDLTGQALPLNGEGTSSPWREGMPTGQVRGEGFTFRNSSSRSAFTLIELLVVILIIGILAAIALPQYQKAVERAKAKQGIAILKQAFDAAEAYNLEHSSWPTHPNQLDYQLPWKGTTKWYTYSWGGAAISNEDWSLQMYNGGQGGRVAKAVYLGRISGPYAGTGFTLWLEDFWSNTPTHKILCVERTSNGITFIKNGRSKGDYCQKILGGTPIQKNSEKFYLNL